MSDVKQKAAEILAAIEKRLAVVEKYHTDLSERKQRNLAAGTPDPEFSFARAIYGLGSGNWTGREFERDEMVRGAEYHRALGFGTGDGANIVPPEYVATLIDMLRPMTAIMESGVTTLNLSGGQPLTIPRQTTAMVAAYKAEHIAMDASDPGIDQVTASPHTLTALAVYSNELLRLSNPSIEGLVRNDIAQQFAGAMDLFGLEGDGIAPNTAGVVTYATDVGVDAAPDFDTLTTLIETLETANAYGGSTGFITHPRDYWNLARTKDSTGQYLLQPATAQGVPATFWGEPVRKTTHIAVDGGTGADSNIYFGNWADLLAVFWGGLEILASQEAEDYFRKNQTGVRGILMHDWAPRHDESFVMGTGVIPPA